MIEFECSRCLDSLSIVEAAPTKPSPFGCTYSTHTITVQPCRKCLSEFKDIISEGITKIIKEVKETNPIEGISPVGRGD